MATETSKIIDDAMQLMSEEREALTAGQLDRIGEIVKRKEHMVQEISRIRNQLGPDELARLRNAADRNERLFDAAVTGIKTVQKRIEHLKSEGTDLKTYAADGERAALAPRQTKLERRT